MENGIQYPRKPVIRLSSQDNIIDPIDPPPPRYVVGIDLGTTNCAIAYVDTLDEDWSVDTFAVPQWVDVGQIESRETLPSFHYELSASEITDAKLPWQPSAPEPHCVGVMARDVGSRHPGRRISSAKSWLSHDGVDRSADFLPWHGDADVTRMSPVAASARYLSHLKSAWDHHHPDHPLDQQDVVVTLPASFDEVARELTIGAAKQAGLRRVHLIEEPQAAFYAWIDRHRGDWMEQVRPGQLILVCDIGGGTTDLTLIRVQPAGDDGDQVQFHRVAVGRHLILGGDNMDLAVAKLAEAKIRKQSDVELSSSQWDRLVQAARGVKETMLSANRPDRYTIHLSAEGSSLLAGSIQVELSAAEVDETLLDGFFPIVDAAEKPDQAQSGFQEFGLPYAADPAVTRHLAEFLAQHRRSGLDDDDNQSADRPDLVLFNGGVMVGQAVRNRITDSLKQWFGHPNDPWRPTVLSSPRLDLAVAHGAAYYAMVRRGKGVHIAANLGRSYYMQVADQPPTALCLIPGTAEAGQRFRAADHPLQLQVGAPVQFPLWVSSTRLADRVGELIPIESVEMSPLPPICTALVRGRRRDESELKVCIESELSEIGTVGMFCVDLDSGKRWKLDFDIRSTLESDRQAHDGSGETSGIVDGETVQNCADAIAGTFASAADLAANRRPEIQPTKPNQIVGTLQKCTDSNRNAWPPSLLREMWGFLLDHESGRRQSAQHEARWINLAGFCLRPGYGVAVDDWRVQETWRRLHGKLAFAAPQSRTESLILWRRIAGGLSSGQQQQLAAPLIAGLHGKTGKIELHEASEIWRLLASLERLSVGEKQRLGELAIVELQRKKNEKLRPVLLWSIGRLGTRRPIYGPLNTTVSPAVASRWIEKLVDANPPESVLPLTIVQLARMTGDRYRDVSSEARTLASEFLESQQAPIHFQDLVTQGGTFDSEEQAAVFGDSLPLGIRLLRG
ncbi:Chaperone protein DnaK [Rubripirellula lacrimiformis]|uniref:Chaperone protein DnaK n=1 Tax=Rubripirellula lacrimiformis TaxID=1930273 RepID=A0A517NDU7_9BACT|nr:hsp70 family protein [Rubripirellula lacrimiformis]QDT05301.1 Chaperone protein DnaK [Rubripirellula lacrimiformis]